MNFISLDLSRLTTFKFAHIERLELEFFSAVQVILGTNGCGKSSLLRELSPLPSPRTSFEPGGYKKLVVSHRGHEYVITSNYASKTSPHSFQKAGVELNAGGTTQVQEELVSSELGYTAEVAALVTGEYHFTKMPAGMRKTLLINLNPCQIGFVLDYHKQVSSKIRACKANLVMLQERKFLLEQEFIPVPQQELLKTERQRLQREIEIYIEFLHRTDERLQSLGHVTPFTPELTPADARQHVTTLIRSLHQFSKYREVPRDNQREYEKHLLQTIALYDGRLTGLQEQLRDVIEIRNADHAVLAELNAAEMGMQAELRVHARQAELATLQDRICAHPVAPDRLALWVTVGPQVHTLCQQFLDCGIKLRSADYVYKHRQICKHWQYVFQENQLELNRLGEEVARTQSAQKIRLEDIPDTPCAKQQCPLYSHFRQAYDRRTAELTRLTNRRAWLQRRNSRIACYLEHREAMLRQHDHYAPSIQALILCYDQLGEPVPRSLLTTLNHDPVVLYRQLQDRMTVSEATYRYRTLQTEAEQDQWKNTTQHKMAEEEKDRLRQRVAALDVKYQALNERIAAGRMKIDLLKQQHMILLEYQALIQQLQLQNDTLLKQLDQAWLYHNHTELQRLLMNLKQHRDQAIRRLGEIDHILQAQAQLHTRYDEEVLTQLKKVEQDKLEWMWIEAALAKIPVNYTVVFINAVISAMNHYIAKVFSYAFSILSVSPDQPLDYRFAVQVGDVIVPDISLCSDAQQEIINLTFRLALIKQLGLQDYPIHLDEVGKTFDTSHKQRLLDLIRDIMDQHTVCQMFLVNHHALIHEGLTNASILVLNDTNILVPPVYNTHAIFNRVE